MKDNKSVYCEFCLLVGKTDLKMVISDKNEELDEILLKDFTTVFRPGYINVEGVTMPQRFAEMRDDIHNMEVNEDDVWVCSFPKTGTDFECFPYLSFVVQINAYCLMLSIHSYTVRLYTISCLCLKRED